MTRYLLQFTGVLCFFACSSLTLAEGEAGILSLRSQGHFYVGKTLSEPAGNGAVQISNQMYVGYQLPAEKSHPYPLILVHGGSGQSSDWFSTPDGRDGWRDYFVAAGFDVYWVDRPGYGRSPVSSNYGELGKSTSSSTINFMATSENWPGNPADHTDPAILDLLASTPPGPFAGNDVTAMAFVELLDRIGPAIILAHGAGGVSTWWAADRIPAKVAGIIAIEARGSNPLGNVRRNLTFDPPLPAAFEASKDQDGCNLQAPENVSKLVNLAEIKIFLVASELGFKAGMDCDFRAQRQAGLDTEFVYLPELGFRGNGHLMMAETNNGELAGVIIRLAEKIK